MPTLLFMSTNATNTVNKK